MMIDNTYDLSVRLDSISGNKADITTMAINEVIPAAPVAEPEVEEPELSPETAEDTTAEPSGGSAWGVIGVILIIAVIVGIVALVIVKVKQRR